MLTLARWTQPDVVARARTTGVPEFLTITYSHYVEYARWSLELGKKPFVERGYMPGQHILPLLALRVGGTTKHLSSSSFVTKMTGPGCDEQKQSQANRKRSTAVPALVLADGTVLTDSWSIAAHSGLAPIGDEQRELYDKELGPLARQFAYGVFLSPANRPLWDRVLTKNQGWLWRLTYYFFGNPLWKVLRTLFAVGDAKAEEECEKKLMQLCKKIEEERLGGVIAKKHAYINGDEYTLEDVALCSLFGPAAFPPQYCAGVFKEAIDELEAKGDGGFDKIKRFRETEIGRYVARFYQKHR